MGVLIDIGLRKLWFASYEGNKIHGVSREGRRFFGMCTMGLLPKIVHRDLTDENYVYNKKNPFGACIGV